MRPSAEPARERRPRASNAAVPRSGDARAPGDLGEQAALAADRARQHRRGDVDHRGGVAGAGTERQRQGRDPVRVRAPTRSPCSARGPTRTDGRGSSARRATRGSRWTTPTRCGRSARASSWSWRRPAAARQAKYRERVARQRPDPRRDEGISSCCPPPTSSAAGVITPSDSTPDGRWRFSASTPPTGCSARSIRSTRSITLAGVHFRVVGVAEKKGADLRPIAGRVRRRPARGVPAHLRHRGQSLQLDRACRPTRRVVQAAMDDATLALRIERRLRPKEPDNFGVLSSETFLNIYNQATSAIFAILIGVVSLSLVVGGIVIMNIMLMVGQRTDARDRPAQVARRAPARHPLADPHRVGHAVDVRRHRRHRAWASWSPGSSAS